MYQELSWWILNQEPWTPFVQDHSDNYSDQITLFSDKPVQETIGPKVTILKVLNLLIPSSMLLEKKLKDVTAFRDSKSPTPLVVVLDLVWVPFLSPR